MYVKGLCVWVWTETPGWPPPRGEKHAEDAGHNVCTFLVTCFCGVDVLIVVAFISEDLSCIVKKKKKKSFGCVPCPEIHQGDELVYLYRSITAASQCKFSSNL